MTEALLLLLLILANGVFALAEMAVVSSRKARLRQAAEAGDPGAKAALALAEEPGHFLSTVQVGITLIGVLTGAFGGATLARLLEPSLERIPALRPYADSLSLGIVVVAITYLSLVLGELIPKRLALSRPERIATLMARPMTLLSRLASPAVMLLSLSTEGLLRLLGYRPANEPPVTEEEIGILIRQGTVAGVFEEAEGDMIERVLRLGDRRVRSMMTPRPDVTWLDADASLETVVETVATSGHSAFPVYRDHPDHVVGVVRAKDLLALRGGEPWTVTLQKPLFVPEALRSLKLLELFKETGVHLALVTDEYGGVQGLVTLTDLLEAVVGDLPGADDPDGPEAVRRGDGSWLLDGMMPMARFKELFPEAVRDLDDAEFDTVAGLILSLLRRIPVPGDAVEWNGLRLEVLDMDGRRVDKVLVTPVREWGSREAGKWGSD